jgi:hypothetical protein
VGVTSSEIQEVREGLGASLLLELEEDGVRITDIGHSTWAAAYEVDALDDKAEKVAAHRCLERSLGWARLAFGELILPAMTVSPLKPGA